MEEEVINRWYRELENIVSTEHGTSKDFDIDAKWNMGEDPSRLMNVTGLFPSKEEMEEAGINKESRLLRAYSPLGFNKLREMGFSSKEIKKVYGDKNTSK